MIAKVPQAEDTGISNKKPNPFNLQTRHPFQPLAASQ